MKRHLSEAVIAFQDEDTGRTEGQEPALKVGGGLADHVCLEEIALLAN